MLEISNTQEYRCGGQNITPGDYIVDNGQLVPLWKGPCAEAQCTQKKEKKMYMEFDYGDEARPVSEAAVQRNYLLNRLDNANSEKENKLRHQFGLVDDDAPQTLNELFARISAGKYVVDEDKLDKKVSYIAWMFNNVQWRDPATKKDEAGFNAAADLLRTQSVAARDVIMVSSAEDGLKAVQNFETWTLPTN